MMVQDRPTTRNTRIERVRDKGTAPSATPPSAAQLNEKLQPQRLTMAGLDGVITSYVTTPLAAEILGTSRRVIQAACSRYWKRILDARERGESPDVSSTSAKRNELVCLRLSAGRDAQYWVREDAMGSLFVNKRDETGKLAKPGRPAGTSGTKRAPNKRPRKP